MLKLYIFITFPIDLSYKATWVACECKYHIYASNTNIVYIRQLSLHECLQSFNKKEKAKSLRRVLGLEESISTHNALHTCSPQSSFNHDDQELNTRD